MLKILSGALIKKTTWCKLGRLVWKVFTGPSGQCSIFICAHEWKHERKSFTGQGRQTRRGSMCIKRPSMSIIPFATYEMLNRCETRCTSDRTGAEKVSKTHNAHFHLTPWWKRLFFFLRHTVDYKVESLFLSLSRLRGCPRNWLRRPLCSLHTFGVESNSFHSGHALLAAPWRKRNTSTDPTLTCGVCESPGGDGAEWDDGFLFQSLECCWIAVN